MAALNAARNDSIGADRDRLRWSRSIRPLVRPDRPRRDLSLDEGVLHRPGGHTEPVGDACQRPANVIEAYGLGDSIGIEEVVATLNPIAFEDGRNGPAVDGEGLGKYVHAVAGSVTVDQVLDLVGSKTVLSLARRANVLVSGPVGRQLDEATEPSTNVCLVRVGSQKLHCLMTVSGPWSSQRAGAVRLSGVLSATTEVDECDAGHGHQSSGNDGRQITVATGGGQSARRRGLDRGRRCRRHTRRD